METNNKMIKFHVPKLYFFKYFTNYINFSRKNIKLINNF